jgi:hypothetical protein
MREFNVTGLCVPDKHYMVDISEKVRKIIAMVEKGDYFTINRARQYGKTTILFQLELQLAKECTVIAISFEGVSEGMFETEAGFCQGFLYICSRYFSERNLPGSEIWIDSSVTTFDLLDAFLNKVCNEKKIVLMIDETDKTSNNLIFLRFLGMLRDKYLRRGRSAGATFQSVILAGVYDIKNLKLKMSQAGTHQLQDGEKRINSPWNIAAHFKIDMSFSAPEIATMLNEYEKDHQIGMDTEAVSKEIRAYTHGYPYLVSRLCQIIDDDLEKDWTVQGVQKAVRVILYERNLLFDDLGKNLEGDESFYKLLYDIVVYGQTYNYSMTNHAMEWGIMFGILRKQNEQVIIDNLIFETIIYNHFITKRRIESVNTNEADITRTLPEEVIENGKLNMALCIKKFMQHYYELYSSRDDKFLESECRILFLTYLKPILNGKGFYHIEPETRNRSRMDMIVDFGPEQFIVELKIWHGEQKHEKAYEQLIEYLNSKNKTEGYLLTFDFRKRRVKKPSAKWVRKSKKKFLDCLCV